MLFHSPATGFEVLNAGKQCDKPEENSKKEDGTTGPSSRVDCTCPTPLLRRAA